jgi:hypothetical protein
MAKREILDTLGRSTGERLVRYVWRSKPTLDPTTSRHIRCLVAQDEKGQHWAATRIGRGDGNAPKVYFWEAFQTKDRAMAISREQTRSIVATRAELYADTVNDKKPGEKIVEVTMDDGWSVRINAPEKPAPPSRALTALLDRLGQGKKIESESPAKRKTRSGPSR